MKRLGLALGCLWLAACSEPVAQSGVGFTGVGYTAPVETVAFAPTASPTTSPTAVPAPPRASSPAAAPRQSALIANAKPSIVARLASAPPVPAYRVTAGVSSADLMSLTQPAQTAIREGLPRRNMSG